MDRMEVLKALAHPVRVEFLEWMKEPERHFADQAHPLSMGVCANQFEKRCGLSQSTVSAHLATLEKAGLVRINRVGQWAFYHRDEDKITAFLEELRSTL
ncbi:transcriptional regulator [Neorhizobium sp. SOG26]|uniref:ArsR family transcriptional regulator n=1 Tax=Neorhizobium turbinariae TaxID=2937795 RepID=A0ABT0IKT6_9HYPH|nr:MULTISPECIES: helix-turn-helix transcriptional regulator [Neorhizobium]AXV15847.1 transcriptional regulator [Neorhizobium sp. SOG26]MCK8778487.1 ArsR family transcriptional regulator [Neorhizobium turbinariae]